MFIDLKLFKEERHTKFNNVYVKHNFFYSSLNTKSNQKAKTRDSYSVMFAFSGFIWICT